MTEGDASCPSFENKDQLQPLAFADQNEDNMTRGGLNGRLTFILHFPLNGTQENFYELLK